MEQPQPDYSQHIKRPRDRLVAPGFKCGSTFHKTWHSSWLEHAPNHHHHHHHHQAVWVRYTVRVMGLFMRNLFTRCSFSRYLLALGTLADQIQNRFRANFLKLALSLYENDIRNSWTYIFSRILFSYFIRDKSLPSYRSRKIEHFFRIRFEILKFLKLEIPKIVKIKKNSKSLIIRISYYSFIFIVRAIIYSINTDLFTRYYSIDLCSKFKNLNITSIMFQINNINLNNFLACKKKFNDYLGLI